MVRRFISDEIKEVALSMSFQGLSDQEISHFTGISTRALRRLRKLHRETGAVSRRSPGRFRLLTAIEAKVCPGLQYLGWIVVLLYCLASSLVTVSSAHPMLPLWSCRQSSEKFSASKSHCRPFCALSTGLVIPGRQCVLSTCDQKTVFKRFYCRSRGRL